MGWTIYCLTGSHGWRLDSFFSLGAKDWERGRKAEGRKAEGWRAGRLRAVLYCLTGSHGCLDWEAVGWTIYCLTGSQGSATCRVLGGVNSEPNSSSTGDSTLAAPKKPAD